MRLPRPPAQLTRQCVHLLGHQRHELGDRLIGENALADLLDDEPLDLLLVPVTGMSSG